MLLRPWYAAKKTLLGRTSPDLDTGHYFDWAAIKAAYLLAKQQQPARPSLNEVLRLIAQRGGFFVRKGDGEPGSESGLEKANQSTNLSLEALQEMNSAYD